MSKYAPLVNFLKTSTTDDVSFTFSEIEKIIDARLPKSALTSPHGGQTHGRTTRILGLANGGRRVGQGRLSTSKNVG
jgi:hypothetical protein